MGREEIIRDDFTTGSIERLGKMKNDVFNQVPMNLIILASSVYLRFQCIACLSFTDPEDFQAYLRGFDGM